MAKSSSKMNVKSRFKNWNCVIDTQYNLTSYNPANGRRTIGSIPSNYHHVKSQWFLKSRKPKGLQFSPKESQTEPRLELIDELADGLQSSTKTF